MSKKRILITSAVTIILLGIVFLRVYQGVFKIDTAYQDGSYKIDKREVKPNSNIRLFPGKYQLRVNVEDMEEKVFDFEIRPLKTTLVSVEDLKDAYLDIAEGIKPEMLGRYTLINKLPLVVAFGNIGHDRITDRFTVTLLPGHPKKEVIEWLLKNNISENIENIIWN